AGKGGTMTNDKEQQATQAYTPDEASGPAEVPPCPAADTVSHQNGEMPSLPGTVEYRGPATLDTVPPPGQGTEEVAAPVDSRSTAGAPRQRLGRYRVEQMLGKGGFGQVFLAWDEELQRRVAIKLASSVATDASAEAYLVEARTVARLVHPHIVPVYDVGRTEQGQLFAVSKLIDGRDLAACLKARRLSLEQSVRLV